MVVNRCKKLTTSAAKKKRGPPYSARDCPGAHRKGNDGLIYQSYQIKSGAWRWKKKPTKKPAKPKPQPAKAKPKKTKVIELKPVSDTDCRKQAQDQIHTKRGKGWCLASSGFEIEDKRKPLGVGAGGKVYKACRTQPKRQCDLVLKNAGTFQRDNFDFGWEVYFLRLFQHVKPQIVPGLYAAWACGDTGRTTNLVLERFDGDMKWLVRHNHFTLKDEWLARMIQICRQLGNAGVIHGDIKMDQFLYKNNGNEIVISDFQYGRLASCPAVAFDDIYPMGWMEDAVLKIPDNTKLWPDFNVWQLEKYLIEQDAAWNSTLKIGASPLDWNVGLGSEIPLSSRKVFWEQLVNKNKKNDDIFRPDQRAITGKPASSS